MSESKNTRDASTCHKLPPPGSLRGEEDAEVTWDLISKRYPNAAPLLCQMETVIDRAEALLRQLRSPYAHVLDKSSSFEIADMGTDEPTGAFRVEESTEISAGSEEDSRPGSPANMTPEMISVAGCSLSDRISDDGDGEMTAGGSETRTTAEAEGSSEERSRSLDVAPLSLHTAGSKSLRESESAEIEGNLGGEESRKFSISSIANVAAGPATWQTPRQDMATRRTDRQIPKSSSLEAWGKVAGETVARCESPEAVDGPVGNSSSNGDASPKAGDSVSEHARRLTSLQNGPMQQITKLNLLGRKEELGQRFAGTIAAASRILDATRAFEETDGTRGTITADGESEDVPRDAKIEVESPVITKAEEFGERLKNPVGNISQDIGARDGRKGETRFDSIQKSRVNSERNEGNGDEAATAPGFGPRSPIEILDEYSRICGIPVEYIHTDANSRYNRIVKCRFAGFAFDAWAPVRRTAKKDAAAKLLRCLVGKHIDGENVPNLTPFTRKQIEEIIALGNGGENETAVRKLYKTCAELRAAEPIYTVHQESAGMVGNRYSVKCNALGITASGCGIGVFVAKRAAAEQILLNCHRNRDAPR